METSEIRESLHYLTYVEHSKSIKYAADENLRLFIANQKKEFSEANRIKELGFYRSTLLLYAISIELILKASGLFLELNAIKNGEINTFNDFLNKWRKKD